MRNKLFVKVLGYALSATLAFTSAVPSMAAGTAAEGTDEIQFLEEEAEFVEGEGDNSEDPPEAGEEATFSVAAEAQDTVLFGKAVSTLQSGIEIVDPEGEEFGLIGGTLKKVTGWTDTFGEGLGTGHYLALKMDAPEGYTIKAGLVPSALDTEELTTLDEDKNIVLKITNKDHQFLKVEFSKEGEQTVTKKYSLILLELEDFAATFDFGENEQDLLGKAPSDLQEDMKIQNALITGKLKYVKDYTGFSSAVEEQSGHYLAVDVDIPGAKKLEYGVKKLYSTEATAAELEAGLLDRELVIIIDEESLNEDLYGKLSLRVTYADDSVEERCYYIDNLVLLDDPDAAKYTATITYDLGGGVATPELTSPETVADITGEEGFILKNLTGITVAKDGYTFTGWTVNTEAAEFAKVIKSEDSTLLVLEKAITGDIAITLTANFEEAVERTLTVAPSEMESFGEAFGGKGAADLQSDLEIYESGDSWYYAYGTLKEVKGWTQFGGEGLTSGHYIAIKVDATGTPKKLEASVENGDGNVADLTNDPDKTAILRIRDTEAQSVLVTATYADGTVISKTIVLRGLKMEGMELDANIDDSIDLLGKKASDLQKNIRYYFNDDDHSDGFNGLLHYVAGYTGFSSNPEEQSGYFLALHGSFAAGEKMSIINGAGKEYPIDPADGLIVLRMTEDYDYFTLKKTYADGSYSTRNLYYGALDRENPAKTITLEAPEDKSFGEAFGNKKPSDLQKDIVFENSYKYTEEGYSYTDSTTGKITGTLKKVTGWEASWGKGLGSGHYLAFKVTVPGATKIEAGADNLTTLDEDGIAIIRIRDKSEQQIRVVATYPGGVTAEKTYKIMGLTLEGFDLDVNIDSSIDLLGKKVTDLQKNVRIEVLDDSYLQFYGNLKFVPDYTGFSSNPEEQTGYFLALHSSFAADEKVVIVNKDGKEYPIDPADGLIVLKVSKDSGTITLKKTYSDGSEETAKYWIDIFEYEKPESIITVTAPQNKSFGEAFGNKKPSDLQENITVTEYFEGYDDNGVYHAEDMCAFHGTLKKVTGWEASWGKGLGSGHYLAFKVTVPGATKIEAGADNFTTLDEDGIAIIRIRDKFEQCITVQATFASGETVSRKYMLDDLELEGFGLDAAVPGDADLFGKKVSDLQENIKITESEITGTLLYVDDYSSAFGEGMNKGHYIALHATMAEGEKDYIISQSGTKYAIDPADGLIVLYVAEEGEFTLLKTYEDGSEETRTYFNDPRLALKDEVLVTLHYNNGDADEILYYSKGDKLEQPSAYRRGYKFEGWFKDAALTTAWDFEKDTLEGNTDLYSKWSALKYKVSFNANGGTGTMADQEFTFDQGAALTANAFVKEGYEFVGWAIDSEDSIVLYQDRQYVDNLISVPESDGSSVYSLWAVWTKDDGHKHQYTATWTWSVEDYSEPVTLTLKCEGEVLYFMVEPTVKYSGNRTTYYVEYTYKGVKYSDSKTFVYHDGKSERVTEDAFSYDGVYNYSYTGKAITQPDLKVYWGDSILVEKVDYTVSYKNNINAGKATLTITGKGQFDKAFTQDVEFTILPFDLSRLTFADVTITDKDKVPATKVKYYGKTLSKKDYAVTYSDTSIVEKKKAKAGEYTATIKPAAGNTNFTGEGSFTLTVLESGKQLPADKLKITIDAKTPITKEQVEGDGYIPVITIKNGKDTVVSTEERFSELFDVSYSGNHNARTAKVTITAYDDAVLGDMPIVGSVTKEFTIKGQKFSKELKKELNVIKNKSVPYTGNYYSLESVLTALGIKNYEYAPSLDRYSYQVKKNRDAGKMTITIIGYGIYNDKLDIPVKIAPVEDYEVDFEGFVDAKDGALNEVPYRKGGAVVNGLTVRALSGGFLLREGVDYTVSYKNNGKVGETATLVIKGKRNYGTMKVPFKVVQGELSEYTVYTEPTLVKAEKVEETKTKIANGKIKPTVKDLATGKKLVAGKDFAFAFGAYDEETKSFSVTLTEGTDHTFAGEVTLTGIRVRATALSKKNVVFNFTSKSYTGKAITLDEDDFQSAAGMAVYGEDFEIVGYQKNIKSGTAKVMVQAIGDKFTGKATLSFKIDKATKKAKN